MGTASFELGQRALELKQRGADPDALLDAFLTWAAERKLSLYPAQEEAILELFAGKHVVLATPTGSGKSLVATALMFGMLATGGRGYYTFPIKALVSEKFFELCDVLGPDNVGMMTGDASINRDAPIICCTAEILSNLALCEGPAAAVDAVVMDEFHFYSDPDRGIAWQVPLLTLPEAQFLLMSATLGDMTAINESIARITGAEVSVVTSDQRPVPLDFSYQEIPLTATIEKLIANGKAPIYIVSFSHREAVELAQALTSLSVVTKEQRKVIAEALAGFRFDTPFGKDLKRCLLQGIGLHHAGLLPKYRRLVERLTQQGKLAVICGTDTLGVGINVPIRTVLFTKLCKYDGEGTRRLTVRELKQIAGRAGRRGYDTEGNVVAQAPEHVIENKVLAAKAEADPGKKKKMVFKKPPERGYAHWDQQTFERLASGTPEPLESRFKVDHGMLLNLLERPSDVSPRGYRALIRLIADSHEREHVKRRLRARSKELFVALRNAQIVHLRRTASGRASEVVIDQALQRDFSMHHSLSLYLVEALETLDPSAPSYALDVLSFVEAILENPGVVLDAQQRKLRDALFHKLKAEGVEHDERLAELEKVTYPKPNAELIYDTFNSYAKQHPWVKDGSRGADTAIRPKSVMRDMHEQFLSFNEYVREYGIARAEGVLLRYLTDAYKTLVQTVPERYWNDDLVEVAAFMRSTLERVDASLLAEWESMRTGEAQEPIADSPEAGAQKARALLRDPRMLRARIRSELHMLVKALSFRDYDDAAACVAHLDTEDGPWTPERFEAALAPFYAVHERIVFDHAARNAQLTLLDEQEKGLWRVRQVLVDPEEANDWYLECRVDLRAGREPEGPLIELVHIGQ